MRRIVVSTLLLLWVLPPSADAGETITVGADSLLFSEIGALVTVAEPGLWGQTLHCTESAGKVRIYGARDFGSDDWEIPSIPVYLCPRTEMLPGLAWKFPDDDFGNPRTAEAVGQEAVTVPVNTFPNAWRVEVTRDDQPSVIHEVYWFVANVGLVKHTVREAGQVVRKSELLSYDVTGTGYFPLEEGNAWQFTDATVAAGTQSFGALKGHFPR